MTACCVEIYSQSASFRHPEFQNLHKTLNLPPPTSIIGFFGAGLGLSPLMAQDFFDETTFKIGVYGTYLGKISDTWKYNKRTNNMHLYDSALDGGIIQRELLAFNRFLLVFASENENKVQEVSEALIHPHFALTMGNSDSIAFVKNISLGHQVSAGRRLENCIVKGDILNQVIYHSTTALNFSLSLISEPIAYDLPRRFNYSSDYGKRSVSEIATFSFIEKEIQVNFDLEGVQYGDVFIPIFPL